MPSPLSSQLVMSPVRPNSTTSESASTKGGVTIGSTDITLSTPA